MDSKKNTAMGGRTIFVFGLTQYFYMLFMNTATTQLNYYVTDILLIPAALAGIILILGRVIEVVSAPAIGLMIEKVKLPWGKYRSWIFIAIFPFAIFYSMVFFGGEFHFNPFWTIVFFSICLLIGSLSGNVVQSVHSALVQGITYADKERKKLIMSKTAGNYFAKAGTGFIGIQLVVYITAKTSSESTGFATVLVGMAVLMVIGYFILGISIEKYKIDSVTQDKDYTAKEMLTIIVKNKPLLCVFGCFFMKSGSYFIVSGLASYYFKYVIGDFSKLSFFFTITNIVALSAVVISKYYFKVFTNKKGCMVAGMIMFTSIILARFFVGNYIAFIVLLSVFTFGDALVSMYAYVLFSEAIDYSEYNNKISLRGLSMSLLTLALDGSRILQQIVIAIGLSILGYTATKGISGVQIPALMNIICLVPAACLAIGMFILQQYNLDEKDMNEYRKTLEQRRTGS